MLQKRICLLIFVLSISYILPQGVFAAKKKNTVEVVDTLPLYRGVAVSFDLVGVMSRLFSDYGQYEAAVRVNLKDRYYPILEVGYGTGSHQNNAVTGLCTKTQAPYGKIGMDYNLLKNKHDIYRLYAGVRYAFTMFDFNLSNPKMEDPVWGGPAKYEIVNEKNYYHWLEGVLGVDVKMTGPFRLGWTARYRMRVGSSDSKSGAVWYVPGYGKHDTSVWSGTFNVILEL